MASSKKQSVASLSDIVGRRGTPYSIEKCQDHTIKEAEQGRLHCHKGVEAYLAALHAWKDTGVCGC